MDYPPPLPPPPPPPSMAALLAASQAVLTPPPPPPISAPDVPPSVDEEDKPNVKPHHYIDLVSPSNIGEYAACPLRLILDFHFPKVWDNKYQNSRDFGTVCHWEAQKLLGCPPQKVPTPEQYALARTCREVPSEAKKNDTAWSAHIARCAALAASTLEQAAPLAAGTRWLSEVKTYKLSLMPDRRGRKGELKGFGGSIDAMRDDRFVLADFKFVKPDKVPEPPLTEYDDPKIENQYVWQVASYHVTEGVPNAGIVWTSRDGSKSSHFFMDFRKQRNQEFAARIRKFIAFVQYKDFPELAWPCRSVNNCSWCTHKGVNCPMWDTPYATLGHLRTNIFKHTALAAALASRKAPPALF